VTQREADARRVQLLSIGAELLLGETVDTNAAHLASELAAIGLPASASRVLPDDRATIADAFADAMAHAAVVIATGGLGPTHDDVTREGLADALGEPLEEDAALLETLEARFGSGRAMPQTNRRQALLVPSARPLRNPIGSAPGWWVERDGCVVVLLPGVPSEMRVMWSDEARPRLEARFPSAPLAIRTVKAFGVGESAMAERLGALIESPPEGVDAGIYARDDGVHVRFSTRGDRSLLEQPVAAVLAALGGDAYGTDDDDLPHAALRRLGELGAGTLASSEAGTGGALLSALAAAHPRPGEARYVGGVLHVEGEPRPPSADVLLDVTLPPEDAHGRSRVRVSVSGAVAHAAEARIHGSGPQRLRRAAYAALDVVRRLSASAR
jgi:nicotinamide-nucleotide amidase